MAKAPSISEITDRLKTCEHYAAFSPDEEVRLRAQHIAAALRWVLGMEQSGHDPGAVTLVLKDHQPPYYTRRG